MSQQGENSVRVCVWRGGEEETEKIQGETK